MRTLQELLSSKDEEDWVVKNILPVNGKLMIGGAPKAGKSFLMLKFIHAVLREQFFHGFKVDTHGRVIVVEWDMPESSHRRRLEKLHGITYDFNGTFHITRKDTPKGFSILNQQHYNWLAEQVRDCQPTVIIFDVLRSLFMGNENDSSAMADVMARIDELLVEGNSSAVLLHHTKKAGFDKDTGTSISPIEAVRGSTVIAGSMDTIIALNETGTSLQIQGRDVGNLSYNLHKEFGGLPNRWIKKNITARTASIEKLMASIMNQCPKESNEFYYKAVSDYVEDLHEEEFNLVRSVVSANPEKYEWA